MKHKLLAGLACLAVGVCEVSTPTPLQAADAAPAVAPAMTWTQFTRSTIDKWLSIDPAFAVYEGAHQFDGKLPDWSENGLKARAAFLRSVIQDAQTFTNLDQTERFERDYLVQVAKGQLFWLEDADQPHRNPVFYINGGLDPNVYISREYADKPTRMKAMIAFFKTS